MKIGLEANPTSDAPLGAIRRFRARILDPSRLSQSLGVADQAIVSGTNLLTTVIIGQTGDPWALGVYSLGFTIVVLTLSAQDAFISLPYTVYGNQNERHRRSEYAGNSLLMCLVSAAVLAGTMLLAALGLGLSGLYADKVAVVFVVALALPCVMLRELGRKMAFAHLEVRKAVWIDLTVALVQLCSLVGLAWAGWLSPALAFVAVAVSCAFASAYWLFRAKDQVAFDKQFLRGDLKQNWAFGRWLAAAQVGHNMQWYALHWLLAVWIGTSATGGISACMSIVMLSNPLLIGLGNVLSAQIAQSLPQGGLTAVRRAVFQTGLLLATAMIAFCVVIALFGDDLLLLLYGEEFVTYSNAASVLALALLFGALSSAADYGLKALGKTAATFGAVYCSLVISLGAAALLITPYGVVGCAYGLLAGSIAGTVVRVGVFMVLSRQPTVVVEG